MSTSLDDLLANFLSFLGGGLRLAAPRQVDHVVLLFGQVRGILLRDGAAHLKCLGVGLGGEILVLKPQVGRSQDVGCSREMFLDLLVLGIGVEKRLVAGLGIQEGFLALLGIAGAHLEVAQAFVLEGEEDFCEEVLGLPLKGFFAQLQALVEVARAAARSREWKAALARSW